MERVNRKDDEKLYQPRIHSKRIRELYKLGEETGLPMTVLVDLAVRNLVSSQHTTNSINSGNTTSSFHA